MLFPGHERSQRLLGDLAHSGDRSKAQERADIEKDRVTRSVDFNLLPGSERVQEDAVSSIQKQKQKQIPTSTSAQARVQFEDNWPNGIPPTGPRKSLKWPGQCHSRQQSSAGEIGQRPIVDGASSSIWMVQRPSLSLIHHTGIHSPVTTKPVDKATSGAGTALECSQGTKACIHDYGQKSSPAGGETGVTISTSTTTTELMDQMDGVSDVQPQGNVELSEYSPPQFVTLLNPTNVQQVPRSSPRLPLTATENCPRNSTCPRTLGPRCPATKRDTPDIDSQLGIGHKDIAYVIKQSQRSGSETASVISAASSTAGKSSSSSISSTMRFTICHTCKKRPFREKLKGCIECSRHYHKGCAKPKDRITEDNWVCRRCLNKLAKKSEPLLSSASELPNISRSEGFKELQGVPALADISGFMPRGSIHGVTSVSDSPSHSALFFEDFNLDKQAVDGEPHTAETREISRTYHSPTAALHSIALSKSSTVLTTKDAAETILEAVKTSVNGFPADLPSYFDGWQAKSQPNAVDASKYLASSSPTVAPSVVDRAIHSSTNLALSLPSNDIPCCVKSSTGDPRIFVTNVGERNPTANHHPSGPSLARETQVTQQSSPKDSPVISFGNTDLSSKDDMASKASGEPFGTSYITSRKEAQRNKIPVAMAGLKIPESPCFPGAIAQPLDDCKAKRGEISQTTKTLSPGARHGHGSNSVLPVKKLCSQCRRLILGSTSLCTKCRQVKDEQRSHSPAEHHSNEHKGAVDLPTMTMAVLHTSARDPGVSKNTITEESSTKKSHCQDDVASPLRIHNQNAIPESPVVPETPDLVSEKPSKSLDTPPHEKAKTEVDQQRGTKPLVPQKRSASGPKATDNEHCFSKKKPRLFKPTTKSIAVNLPPMRPNQFPPTPKSGSPRFEHISRNASVPTTVETVHRGTSPGSVSHEMVDRLDTYAKRSASPDIRVNQATAGQGVISIADGGQHEAAPYSPHSNRASEDWRIEKRSSKLPKQNAKALTPETQYFEPASKAVIGRLKGPEPKNGQAAEQKENVPEEGSCKLEYTRDVASHQSTNLRDRPIESACKWTLSDEKALLNTLQKRGVMFEEDSSSESDVSMPPPRSKSVPKDPLWRCPRSSSDLFLIAPSVDAKYSSFDFERSRKEIAARPFRKGRRLNISYLRQERGDNIHEEVTRTCPPRIVKISSTMTSELEDLMDKNAEGMATGQESELEMTFGDFIGVPANPMAILTKDKRLAFRDGTKDVKGALPRAREKFIVTNRSVACMEK